MTIRPSSDSRPLVYHSDRQALPNVYSMIHLAAVDTCLSCVYNAMDERNVTRCAGPVASAESCFDLSD